MVISEVGPAVDAMPLGNLQPPTKTDFSEFGQWLSQEMGQVNQQIQAAEVQVQKLAAGEEDNLHQVMIALNKASTSFELMVQVRNKVLEGYQELMRMQV